MVVGVSSSLVHIYDSVYDYVADDTKMQIAAIVHSTESSYNILSSQRECLTVEYIPSLTLLIFLSVMILLAYMYKQDEMKAHFLECMEQEHFTPFPSSAAMPRKPKPVRLPIYCTLAVFLTMEKKE